MTIAWSPYSCLPKASLTASGLLELDSQDNEVELIRRSPVELRHEGVEPMAPAPASSSGVWQSRTGTNLTLVLTTHRLVIKPDHQHQDQHKNDARFLHLSNVHQCEASGGPSVKHWNASHKLVVSTYTYGDLVLANFGNKADRDDCLKELEKALERRAWELATRLQQKQSVDKKVIQRRVGVDHILAKQKMQQQQTAKLTDQALSGDSEHLLKEATELIQIIQKNVAIMRKQSQSTGASSNQHQQQQKQQLQLDDLLQDMGMTSALDKTHYTDKSQYYELLARQLADFLLQKIPTMDSAGIVTLTDVFCLFNRARGTNLISPEDLIQACNLLGQLQLGISQRTFPSGIVVLQLDRLSMTTTPQRLVDLCPITPLEASHILQTSPLLAQEQFEEVERMGFICRDVTLETTRFYANRFKDW